MCGSCGTGSIMTKNEYVYGSILVIIAICVSAALDQFITAATARRATSPATDAIIERITVLEKRVEFLENQLPVEVKCEQTPEILATH
jgi:hypothetical protein